MRRIRSLLRFEYHYLVPIRIRGKQALEVSLRRLFVQHGKAEGVVNFVFCSDAYLLEINRQHLQHDFYTDIVTFDLSPNKGKVLADLYISADRLRDNARQLGVPLGDETLRVMIHGVLHLCGFKDKTASQIRAIRAEEDRILKNIV